MDSVIVHLQSAKEAEVINYLTRKYPSQKGPPWIYQSAGEACLYIGFFRPSEGSPEEWESVRQAFNGMPTLSIIADISGRNLDGDQAKLFVLDLLHQFDGCAADDYTDHCWTESEISSGQLVQGHAFNDQLGWYETPRTKTDR